MQPSTYILTLAVAYLGIIGGLILAKIAKEELKDGKKYFLLVQTLLSTLIIGFFLYFYNLNIILVFLISFIALAFLFYFRKHKHLPKLSYILFGFVFYFSSKIEALFILESILIFLYGLPSGSLDYRKKIVKVLLGYLPFLILGLLLYLIRI